MWGDIQTLMGNGSWQDKAKALLDLGFNIFMDASMFTGVGEEARVAELAVKEGADLGEHLLEDSAEHAAEACGLSFAATTLVASASGEVAISSLHVGDQVWAYNSSTHKMELEPVQHVWINHDNDLLDLTIQPQTKVPEAAQKDAKPETIHTTRKHPFLTVERGFLPANALKPGMHVIEANGHIGVITKWVVVAGQATMYNLTVAHDHTYAVGVGQWVVHNCSAEWIKQLPGDPQELINNGWEDVTHPQAKLKSNSMELSDPATGRRVRFDQGVPGKSGFAGQDHYHVYNPNSVGDVDKYLDINGNPVSRGSRASHIFPGP